MFHKEFFPTPVEVIEQMNIDCHGKTVLEPSAGKGDIVKWLKAHGAKDVIACELVEDLRKILSGTCRIIGEDFFKVTPEQVSHIQMIVMNPPFSNADRHIMHAWEIAPEGCEIISLCNWETIKNSYSRDRRELESIIESYGDNSVSLGNCFDTAERKTNVEVGLVRLFKPVTSSDFDYDGFYLDVEEEQQADGIMQYNEIRSVVNKYVAAINCFDKLKTVASELHGLTDVMPHSTGVTFNVSYNKQVFSKDDFAKEMQRASWAYIFSKLNMNRFVTSGVMKDINKFIESRSNYPFTMKNIYRMMEIIVGTRPQVMNRAIEEAVDNITKHTHENRFGVEGWKTNSGYMLNQKFIVNYYAENSWGRLSVRWGGNRDKIEDLTKALCYVTGVNYDDLNLNLPSELAANHWYDYGFFMVKVFKKGTGHFKFKNEQDWYALNRAYAKIKGETLPEKSYKKAA